MQLENDNHIEETDISSKVNLTAAVVNYKPSSFSMWKAAHIHQLRRICVFCAHRYLDSGGVSVCLQDLWSELVWYNK